MNIEDRLRADALEVAGPPVVPGLTDRVIQRISQKEGTRRYIVDAPAFRWGAGLGSAAAITLLVFSMQHDAANPVNSEEISQSSLDNPAIAVELFEAEKQRIAKDLQRIRDLFNAGLQNG